MKKLFTLCAVLLFASLMPTSMFAQAKVSQMTDDVSTLHCVNAPVLYGLLYRGGTYEGDLIEKGNGIYAFHGAETVAFKKESPDSFVEKGFTSFYAKGNYYVINSVDGNAVMTEYNAESWEKVKDFTLGAFVPMRGSCYNPATGRAYLAAWAKDYSCKQILTIDLNKGTVSELENYGNHFFNVLVVGKDNMLYAIDASDKNLYCIDPVAGDIECVGEVDINDFANHMTSAVTDMKTGITYLIAPKHYGDTNFLYTIDLKTAKCTLLTEMPQDVTFTGLYIPDVEKNAPDAAANIDLQGSNLVFDVPTTTYGGSTLSGNVKANITVDGTLNSFDVTPGSQFAHDFSLDSGLHQFDIILNNDAGDSRLRRFSAFCGTDVPGLAKNVKFEFDSETWQSTITWEAPETTHTGLPLDASNATYSIVRQPEGKIVATGLTEFTYTETLPEARRHYYYEVVANINGTDGDASASNTIIAGKYYEVPFYEPFDDSETWSMYGNNDWVYSEWNGNLLVGGLSNGWFITLPVKGADTEHAYKISFDFNGGGSFESPRIIKVYAAKSQEFIPEQSDSYEFIDQFEFKSSESGHCSTIYVPKDNDDVYFVFKMSGYNSTVNNTFDNLRVDIDASKDAPGAATDIVVTPGEKGAMNATIQFKAPVKNFRGDKDLNNINKVEIYRNSETVEPIKTFENVTPGETLSYLDENPEEGINNYYIRAYDANGIGERAKATVFVGIDIPGTITNLNIKMAGDNNAHLTWTPVSNVGVNGGYVDVDAVRYVVERAASGNTYYEEVTSDAEGSSFDDNTYSSSARQADVDYRVRARSVSGKGYACESVPFLTGYPYPLPYHESFKNGSTETSPWRNYITVGDTSWSPVQDETKTFDGDIGKLIFATDSTTEQRAMYRSPRISLKDVDDPALSFYVYHGYADAPEDAYFTVKMSVDDAAPIDLDKIVICNGETGWMRHVIDLSQYVAAHNVVLYFDGYINGNNSDIVVDNINIDTQVDYDLEILGWSIPDRMDVGKPSKMTVRVLNAGKLDSDDFTVRLYRNGKSVQTIDQPSVKSNSINDFTFEYTPVITEARDSVEFYMRAVMMSDSKGSNNKTDTQKAYMAIAAYPFVSDLKGSYSDGKVSLSWTQPEAELRDEVTDGFDDYQEFIIDGIGDYHVYDGDQKVPIYFNGIAIDHRFELQAWQVWNWVDAQFTHYEVLRPHSGDQMLAAWSATDGRSCSLPNDNWIVSEEITGGTDVRLWAKESQTAYGPESFEIYYASGDIDFTDMSSAVKKFHRLNGKTVDHTDWREYAFTLPDNATHFAIRHNTVDDGLVLFIDDLTYTPRFGGYTDLDLVGYNIYRDGELIGNAQNEWYTDNVSEGNTYSYQVSTVWDLGESVLSRICEVATIDGISTMSVVDGLTIEDGSIVLSLACMQNVAVYTVDGKLVYSNKSVKDAVIPVADGIYNVKIGNNNHKIIVK